MIITTSETITVNAVLKAGTATSYSGKENQLHILLRNGDTSKIITEEFGNSFTVVDATESSDGLITVDVDILDGFNRIVIQYADNIDLDAGSVIIEKIASGFARKIVNETTLTM